MTHHIASRRARVPWITLLGLLLVMPAHANRGMIPFDPDVKLFEPNQRAMIAWNGTEEILVLSTDVHASKATKVLEVLPVPDEPTVKKGDPEVFEKATRLINSRVHRQMPLGGGPRGTAGGVKSAEPAGEVTFHEKIGAHDVSVTHVLSAEGFCEWAEDYLKRAGAENPRVSEPMQGVIRGYIKNGFTWFVYDVIELSEAVKTNSPLQYRFKSSCVYYPLKITRTDNAETNIRLLILSPHMVTNFADLPIDQITMPFPIIDITANELGMLNPDMAALLGNQPGMKLRIWELHKRTRHFSHDLMAY